MKVKWTIIIGVVLFICSVFVTTGYAADISPFDGYDDNDYDKIRAFLELPSLDAGKTNGEYLNGSYISNDPLTWTGVTWDASLSKRITEVDWSNSNLLTGPLDVSDFTNMTNLDVSYARISLLNTTNCTSLIDLNCLSCRDLIALDLSTNTALTSLECGINSLASLNVSNNTALTYLGCASNDLSSLNIGSLSLLEELDCKYNDITSLITTGNPILTTLDCSNNDLITLSTTSNPLLETLVCNNNLLTSIDLSGSGALITLNCSYNNIETINISNNTLLEEMNASGNDLTGLNTTSNTALRTLNCNSNDIVSFNLTANTNLESLSCANNLLAGLNITSNISLTYLLCSSNDISSLDLSANSALIYLYANSNSLTSLNTTNSPSLEFAYASYNDISSVNFSGNTSLKDIRLIDNELTAIDLSTNVGLETINVQSNLLTGLNTSANTLINNITANDNLLTLLNTTNNTVLTNISIANNDLASVDLSTNTGLLNLYISDNELTGLNLNNNVLLTNLYLENNQLTTLDITANIVISVLQALTNPLVQIDANLGGNDISLTAIGNGSMGLHYHTILSNLYAIAYPTLPSVFVDWTDASSSTQISTDAQYDLALGSDHDLNANFTVGVYFDKNGGDTDSIPSFLIPEIGELITKPATDPVYANHIFLGWYQDELGTVPWDFDNDTVSGDLILYAKWVGQAVVLFDENGGDTPSTPSSISVAEGSTISPPGTEPTWAGYTFNGWYIDSNGNTAWDFVNDIVNTNMTLYADWTPIPYTVTYNENGGDTQAVPLTMIVNYDAVIPSPPTPPTRTGYAFTGWFTTIGLTNQWNFLTDTVYGDITLYAGWITQHTVSFNNNGGDTNASPALMTVTYGELIDPQPSPPTRVGHTFNGWYIDADGNTAWNFASDTVTSNLTLFADWIPIPYTVSFNENGGETLPNPTSMIVDYGSLISPQPVSPTLTGSVFVGWYRESTGINEWDFATEVVTGTLTLYAKYASLAEVNFNRNGGDTNSVPSTIFVVPGSLISAPGTNPSYIGHTFNGWYLEPSGITAWDFDNDTVNTNLTLYADWSSIPYTVTYNENGGDTPATPTFIIVDFGELIPSEPTPPTRTGFAFGGWYQNAATTIPWNFASDTVSSNMTLFAKWTSAHTVIFNRNGGDTDAVPSSMTVYTGNIISPAPTPPTRTGHVFNGWYLDAAGLIPWVISSDIVSSDMTLYAGWTQIPYTVTFSENGGDTMASPSSMIVNYGEVIPSQPSPPTLSGFSFVGWYIDIGGNTAWNFATDIVTGNLTLYAKYAELFDIIFDENGGDTAAVPSTMQEFGGELIDPLPTPPTRTGYVFDGWYIDAGGNTAWNFALDTISADITLYAKWLRVFSVTFNENGGDTAASPTSMSITEGNIIDPQPTPPTLTGYSFNGWYLDASGVLAWDFINDTVTSNLILYADWEPIPYLVTYDENGGDTPATPSSLLVDYDSLIPSQPAPPIRAGYNFDGWYVNSSGTIPWNFATDTISGNLTLYAAWTTLHIVTFNNNGGDTEASPATMQVLTGNLISPAPSPPTRSGYIFNGWYLDPMALTPWVFATDAVTSNLTLYADWTPISYTISFDENGGDTPSNPTSMNEYYDSLISPLPNPPSQIGYTFVGWYIDAAGLVEWDFNSDTVAGDLTLYAKWAETHSVVFNENGGDTPAIPSLIEVGDGLIIDSPPSPPTRAQYSFVGWFLDAQATLAWNIANDTVSGDMTLYAGWTDITYTVTFNNNGGDTQASPATMIVANGSIINPEPTSPSRSGYTFEGWYLEAAGLNLWDFAINTVSTDLTLYAKWSEDLVLIGNPANGRIYVGGDLTITPNISGGTWSFPAGVVSVDYSGTNPVFTGLTEGTVTVEYSVGDQTAIFVIRSSESLLPETGQNYTWIIIFLSLALCALIGAVAVSIIYRKRRYA